MSSSSDDRIETRVIHGGQAIEPVTGAVMPPVFQTSTYAQPWPARHTGYEYSRSQNPTREALERCVADLEGGCEGVAFGSGLAASATVLHTLPKGARIVCGDDVYGGTYRQLERVFRPLGHHIDYVDLSGADPVSSIPEGTDMVWLESPTNPLLKVADIRAISARAKAVGATVVVDNTFATPIFQRPLELGADLVLHSTTKYLNGHSDVVGGIVVAGDPAHAEPLRFLQNAIGAVNGPWDAWLTLRGLKTLALRMERHQQNALQIVEWLQAHPDVKAVRYPLSPADPGYAVASSQMSGFGGMVSFVLDADLARAERFCALTRIFTLAESLGGVESLLELPASMTHASVPAEERLARGIEDGLVRLSIGIEHAEDLIADLDQAIQRSRDPDSAHPPA
ncbi:MAG: PLP-dependent transferase [Deltaproteobacteria bacterium]|nr:MAG: PLP-dependent transferase [Deltaproteobacteria bacterium]